MRCLTLAEALRNEGTRCHFVCREHPGNMLEFIRQQGFEALGLPVSDDDMERRKAEAETIPAHAAWLGSDWAGDAQQTQAAMGGSIADWLVVDHYALGASWERAMRAACKHIMVIDDLADREHDCDLLLDQNLGRESVDYASLISPACKVFSGSQYALLRPEFTALRQYSLERRAMSKPNRLLISMGGVDKDNATGQVLEALKTCHLPEECRISVVMGQHAPWLMKVRGVADQMPWATEVLVNVRDMARLMAESDFAIGAAGGTAWERLCLGVPAILVVLAENQRPGAMAMEAVGSAFLLGTVDVIGQNLSRKLSALFADDNMQLMQKRCSALVDGLGASRLANALEALGD